MPLGVVRRLSIGCRGVGIEDISEKEYNYLYDRTTEIKKLIIYYLKNIDKGNKGASN